LAQEACSSVGRGVLELSDDVHLHISSVMLPIVLVLTCLACASDGRRVRTSENRYGPSSGEWHASQNVSDDTASGKSGAFLPMRALRNLLLMPNPPAAFACHPLMRSVQGHVGTKQHGRTRRHRHGIGMQEQGGAQSSVLINGRPCGECGGLDSEENGFYNDVGVFYCARCWQFRELQKQQRLEIAAQRGVWASEDQSAKDAAGPFLYAKAETAIRENNVGKLKAYLEVLPELCAYRGPGARTLFHIAGKFGSVESMRILLDKFASVYGAHVEVLQAPEIAPDAFGISPGEYAFINNHQAIFNLAVDSACDRARPSNYCREQNEAYVKQKLKYEDHKEGAVLVDESGGGVMMGWEEPLMKLHAEAIAPEPGRSVLNIGFGLGLVDGFLQDRQPSKHTIVEAHPDVYAEMCRRGWPEKPGVHIVRGRWEDVIEDVIAAGPYDGVFFDTYNEAYGDMLDFFKACPRLLKPGGRMSFFNGLSDSNIFSHAISSRVCQIDLANLGLATMFQPYKVGEISDETWKPVFNQYWNLETYYVPISVMLPNQAPGEDARASMPTGENVRPTAVMVGDAVGKVLDDKVKLAQKTAKDEGWQF